MFSEAIRSLEIFTIRAAQPWTDYLQYPYEYSNIQSNVHVFDYLLAILEFLSEDLIIYHKLQNFKMFKDILEIKILRKTILFL